MDAKLAQSLDFGCEQALCAALHILQRTLWKRACRICSGPSHPVHLSPEQRPALNLSHSAVMLATKGLTSTRLGNQVSLWGNVCEANFSRLKTLSQPSWLQHWCASEELFPCPSQPVVLILLFPPAALKAGSVPQPAGSLPASCAAGSQQFFPASQGMCRRLTFLYVVPGSLLPFPDTGVFHARLCKLPLCWVLGIGASAGRNLLVSGLN